MRFAYSVEPQLPALAWCARVERGHDVVQVRTGADVERFERFFAEGAWNGPLASGRLAAATVAMGSGAELAGDRVIFCAPTHTLERLWVVRRGASVHVSNSLPMVLADSGARLDPLYCRYRSDLRSVAHGLRRWVRKLPCLGGGEVEMVCHANLAVSRDARADTEEKPWAPSFPDWAAYRGFLSGALAALRENAGASERRRRYTLLASMSRGYDSPAGAALASEVGCDEAFSFRSGWALRDGSRVDDDSGAAIARTLGLRVHEIDVDAFDHSRTFTPAEFAALGDTCDVQFAGLEELLPGRVLCTGFHGDGMWERTFPHVGPDIVRDGMPTGSSLAELRLRVGFIHVPVPFIGCRRHAEIHAIGEAAEMRPWQLGGDYDRPIPRRILEERGVPRELFGQVKRGSFAMLDERRISQGWLEGLGEFHRVHDRRRSRRSRSIARLRFLAERLRVRLERSLDRAGLPFPSARLNWSVIEKPDLGAYGVAWGVGELIERYRLPKP